MTTLVIVESPNKVRSIAGYLGDGYVVDSSVGHIRDLPKGADQVPAKFKGESWARLGVNVDDGFEPIYVVSPDKKQQMAKLKKLLKESDELVLATDEDREGEAIAWHLLDARTFDLGREDIEIPGRLSTLVAAGLAPLRQLKPVREMSREYPEAELPAMDSSWFNLVKYDSAVVSMNDGSSVALYQRDPALYRDLLKRTLEIHRRFHREWPQLAQQYRDALGEITSPEAWDTTFAPYMAADEGEGT